LTELAGVAAMELFPFVGPEHPFYSDIARLRTEVSRHPLWRDAMHRTSPTAVRTLMRGRQIPGGEWRLQWVYVSFQFRDESRPLRFDALTLLYSAKTQQIDAYEFPRDPYLPTAASFFADAASGPMGRGSDLDVDVRRYVPRRRLTFLVRRPLEGGAPVVGKFVRNAELETAYETLGEVYRAVARTPSIFSVAAPRGIDRNSSVFFQEARSAEPLTVRLETDRSSDVLRSVGAIHRDVHTLDVRHVPTWDIRAFVDSLNAHVQWIAFFCPAQATFLESVRELLITHVPRVDPDAYAFCHGDFRCSHVLQDDESSVVIDFDAAMRADPYLEVAKLMALLKHDVPFFRQRFVNAEEDPTDLLTAVCQAYVEGYQERARQTLNPKRLLWYRIGCEIHYLARMIARDLLDPIPFDRVIRLLHDLSEQFRGDGARSS